MKRIAVVWESCPGTVNARWFDPTAGDTRPASAAPLNLRGEHTFIPPGRNADGLAARGSVRVWGAPAQAPDKPLRIIVDADTANEIDDAFALTRALVEPRFRIKGITPRNGIRRTRVCAIRLAPARN